MRHWHVGGNLSTSWTEVQPTTPKLISLLDSLPLPAPAEQTECAGYGPGQRSTAVQKLNVNLVASPLSANASSASSDISSMTNRSSAAAKWLMTFVLCASARRANPMRRGQ